MTPLRIFISSVQKELAAERSAVRDYLRGDPLMRRYFEPFLFEDLPAADLRPDSMYLDQVARCDIYLGLFGNRYGHEDSGGLSPTHREYDEATRLGKYRLVYLIGDDDAAREPKMRQLARQVSDELVRRRAANIADLISGLYAALIEYLDKRGQLRSGPFDAAPCPKAAQADLDEDGMASFILHARRARNFPLLESATPTELLTRLNLLHGSDLTNAAVLLFGKRPQDFLLSSEVKCAHFHGTQRTKPIPSHQAFRGTVFDLADRAIDFVMSKINLRVGTRSEGPQAPVAYEIPRAVVAEAIVNAIAHRDYTSTGSVQVMLFSDRLEVWNPGGLPPTLTLANLREPHGSVPGNPLLADPLFWTQYIERMGTGTEDMIAYCRAAGLAEPEFSVSDGFLVTIRRPLVQPESGALQPESGVRQPESQPESAGGQQESETGQQESRPESAAGQQESETGQQESLEVRIMHLLAAEPLSRAAISRQLGQRDISGRLNQVIVIMLNDQTIEYTIPQKPSSRMQRYRLTDKGAAFLAQRRKGAGQ